VSIAAIVTLFKDLRLFGRTELLWGSVLDRLRLGSIRELLLDFHRCLMNFAGSEFLSYGEAAVTVSLLGNVTTAVTATRVF
jgi:hypothetical protein